MTRAHTAFERITATSGFRLGDHGGVCAAACAEVHQAARRFRRWVIFCINFGATCWCLTVAAEKCWAEPPSKTAEAIVTAAFADSHQGWSVDEVLLDDLRRAEFLASCAIQVERLPDGLKRTEGQKKLSDDDFCETLLHLRKAGSKLPATVRRDERVKQQSPEAAARTQTAAEIAARQLQDALDGHTDMILVNAAARAKFDGFARAIAPDEESYLLRKAAIQLRKSRRLEPELLNRVTDWKRTIREATLEAIRAELDSISNRPGVYLFRDATGYLYIGQAARLRERLRQHLLESDRVALAGYIAVSEPKSIQIELHEFQAGSPGNDTRTRRAYESELIRTRKPRLNLAP